MAKSVRKYEIWMCNLPVDNTITKGYRPCVIVSNDYGNTNPDCGIASVVPMTSSVIKGDLPTHIKIEVGENNKLKTSSIALTEQITTISKDSIRFCLGRLNDCEKEKIDKAVLIALGLSPYEKIE